jgi:hypothetical protein
MHSLRLAAATPSLALVNRWLCPRLVPMANRNYFEALAGLKLADSPANSPTAAAASSR